MTLCGRRRCTPSWSWWKSTLLPFTFATGIKFKIEAKTQLVVDKPTPVSTRPDRPGVDSRVPPADKLNKSPAFAPSNWPRGLNERWSTTDAKERDWMRLLLTSSTGSKIKTGLSPRVLTTTGSEQAKGTRRSQLVGGSIYKYAWSRGGGGRKKSALQHDEMTSATQGRNKTPSPPEF